MFRNPVMFIVEIMTFVMLIVTLRIAGMDRALRANVITKSGKAVETAGDIDTLLLDKTGTITIGNRKATQFYPVNGTEYRSFAKVCLMASLSDDTPEGKSIVELGQEKGIRIHDLNTAGSKMIKFTAETKCSGVDPADGTCIRKGAFDAIRRISEAAGKRYPDEISCLVKKITGNGGTPLVVSQNLITFSIANDIAKYFAIIPALFIVTIPALAPLNIMHLHSPESAILSAIIFNAIIIPILIPLTLRGVAYKPIGASALLRRNLLIYGMGGILVPFAGIKIIDRIVSLFM